MEKIKKNKKSAVGKTYRRAFEKKDGTPEGIRTPGKELRRLLLCPSELRARYLYNFYIKCPNIQFECETTIVL